MSVLPRHRAFRPRVEELGGRSLPSTYWWHGWESTDPEDPDNWGPPDGEDPLPGSDDTLIFGPEVWTDPVTGLARDCDGVTALGSSFAGIEVESGYTGTVSLGAALALGVLSIADGVISQPTSGTDITVTNTFTWTGGTLNNSSNLATLTLDGATAEIAPANEGTVYLGSNLNLLSGAVATLRAGTIEMLNDGTETDIGEYCSLIVDPGQGKTVGNIAWNPPVTWGNPTTIEEGGWLTILTGEYNGANASLWNAGGTLVLEAGTSAYFGEVGQLGANLCFKQTSGATYIAADASLQGRFDMKMSDGFISVGRGAKPQNFVGNVFTLGTLKIEGGSIVFDSPGDSPEWSEFKVNGNVEWTSGVYYPAVDATGLTTNADLWSVTGTFALNPGAPSNNATVTPQPLDGEGNVVTPPANTEWQLFTASTAITAPQNNDPILPAGWAFVKQQANPIRWWHLKTN